MGYKTHTCPIARQCGGCEWLAVPYPIQLERKQRAVRELFDDALGRDGAELLEPVGMRRPLGYRHKAATPFSPGKRGALHSGFYARGTHRIVACPSCLVEAPRARETLNAVAEAARRLRVPAYDEDRGRGLLRHAVVRMGWKTDECLLTLVTNGERISGGRELAREIRKRAPWVTAIAQNVNQRRTNAILGRETRALYGGATMRDDLLGVSFQIGPTSFYQTNPEQTERLYSIAIEGARLAPGMRVLDAYCGIGTIGMCAARAVDGLSVVGVERVVGAVENARRNARSNGLAERCSFVCDDATAWMRDPRNVRDGFDVVIMDPPRAGSTPQFLAGAAGLAPGRIVYVSCNPKTQRRDIDELSRHGYRMESLAMVDMFPHTGHAETVAVLVRA